MQANTRPAITEDSLLVTCSVTVASNGICYAYPFFCVFLCPEYIATTPENFYTTDSLCLQLSERISSLSSHLQPELIKSLWIILWPKIRNCQELTVLVQCVAMWSDLLFSCVLKFEELRLLFDDLSTKALAESVSGRGMQPSLSNSLECILLQFVRLQFKQFKVNC